MPGPLRIAHESAGFPAGSLSSGVAELAVSWDDIVWAAVTVGRPNRHFVFRHGRASVFEAIFRWSLVRMAIEQSGPAGHRLRRTNAARTLDPTEKGAVSYFLGMIICKLFATELLDTPWLLHLDVFRSQLNAVLTGRSRPDLVGQNATSGRWLAFECKGRISPPNQAVIANAKAQARRLRSVNGDACNFHIAAITYFRHDVLTFYWEDPPPEPTSIQDIQVSPDAWESYYSPVVELVKRANEISSESEDRNAAQVPEADVEVSIHEAVANDLLSRRWARARAAAAEAATDFASAGFKPDGLSIKAGPSWYHRLAFSAEDIG